jgi:hypothetical protein
MQSEKAMSDQDLIVLAARITNREGKWNHLAQRWEMPGGYVWDPLYDHGARYRMLLELCMSIDSHDCCIWKRMPGGELIQEFWGGEYGGEPRAALRAVAALAKRAY